MDEAKKCGKCQVELTEANTCSCQGGTTCCDCCECEEDCDCGCKTKGETEVEDAEDTEDGMDD